MIRSFFFRLVISAAVLAAAVVWLPRYLHPRAAAWKTIARGVELREFSAATQSGNVQVLALRCAASRLHLAGGAVLDAGQWRLRSGALAAVNGGFFDENSRPLGLRIANGKQLGKLRDVEWGVFYVRNGRAHIVHRRQYDGRRGANMAIQCGPRLVVNGNVVKLRDQWARRTALGVQRDGRVIVAVSDSEIGFREWAALWSSRAGLNCPDAMGLDGGGSTQLSLRTASTKREITGYTAVPDAVVIK